MSGVVYFIGNPDGTGCIKVGHSSSPNKRLRTMQLNSPLHLEILAFYPCDLEFEFHERYIEHRSHGEWFHRCDLIEMDIDAINGGTFSTGCLPTSFTIKKNAKWRLQKGGRDILATEDEALRRARQKHMVAGEKEWRFRGFEAIRKLGAADGYAVIKRTKSNKKYSIDVIELREWLSLPLCDRRGNLLPVGHGRS